MSRGDEIKALTVIVCLFAIPYTAIARPIHVDANAPAGGDGSNWAIAYNHIQDALTDANSNPDPNDIWVAEGVYFPDASAAQPSGTGNRNASFQLINGVGLYGGFPSSGDPNFNDRNPNTYETILSGDLDGNDSGFANNGENSLHVVSSSVPDANAVINGFTITAGNAHGSHPYYLGGGMYNEDNSTPTVNGCKFIGNSADVGGGMFNMISSPKVTNCMFIGNSAYDGGGMVNLDSTPTLTNCTFTSNSAIGQGGGMYNASSSTTVTNCILWGNVASSNNEIYNYFESHLVLSYSNIQGGWQNIGNIDEDPCFADPGDWVDVNDPNISVEPNDPNAIWVDGDYHLKSEAGRWDANTQAWMTDAVTSPCHRCR